MSSDSSTLQIEIEKPASWSRRLTITVPASRLERERDEVTRTLAKRLNLPGFRKGKVPPQVVQRRFGQAIDQELVERVVGEAYKEALEQEKLQPITQGAVERIDYTPGSDLVFLVGLEVRPEIELAKTGGFTVQSTPAQVGDEDVERVVNQLREQHAVWHPLEEGTPSAGDMVQVEITPLQEGEAEEARPYRFTLGEGQAVEDVEDAIKTLTPGSEGEFTIQTASEAEGEQGPEQRVRIRLNEAKRAELPEADDEFAKAVGDFDSVETLRARIREDLEREAAQESKRALRQQLLDQIIEANPFEVPDSMVDAYLERAIPADQGMTEEQVAPIRQQLRPAGERAVKRMLVLERVAETASLHATQDEVDQRVEALAERWGRPVGDVWAQLQKSGRLQAMEEEITEDKVFEHLLSQSTVQEGPAS